ncbi:YciI family protein [Prosthecomicrobium sp. N25]|uniref:YciI family protein n=1 Tax=Prosthecomicrobium sp. N25 TaxID=3129254 RepID=UPI003076E460
MLYLAICRDKPGHLHVRTATRDTHVAWLKSLGTALKIAGPFLDDAGEEMRGSLVVIEADSLDAARAVFAQDPYKAAGLFETVEVKPWRWTLGAPA